MNHGIRLSEKIIHLYNILEVNRLVISRVKDVVVGRWKWVEGSGWKWVEGRWVWL